MKKIDKEKKTLTTINNKDLQYLSKIDYAGEILQYVIKQKREIQENIELIKAFDGENVDEKRVLATLKRIMDLPLEDLENLKTLD